MDILSELLNDGFIAMLSLFPNSPFTIVTDMAAQGQFVDWLGFLNWFIPVYSFLGILQAWLTCVSVYYVWQLVLRWLNVVE